MRIAREVHDELGQALTAMKIELQQLGQAQPRAARAARRDRAQRSTSIVDLVRRIATDLRPSILDDLGVTAALEQQLRRLRESTGITTTLTVSVEPEIDMLTGVTLYRIAQEALANVVRHAEATAVEVSLAMNGGRAVLTIRDNGRGMSRIDRSTIPRPARHSRARRASRRQRGHRQRVPATERRSRVTLPWTTEPDHAHPLR